MPSPLELLPALDAAAQPFVAALAATGPFYMKSDNGWIWIIQADKRSFLGFTSTPVPPASAFSPAPVVTPAPTPAT